MNLEVRSCHLPLIIAWRGIHRHFWFQAFPLHKVLLFQLICFEYFNGQSISEKDLLELLKFCSLWVWYNKDGSVDLTFSGKLEHLSVSVQGKYKKKGFLCPSHKKIQASFSSPLLVFVLINLQLAAVWMDHHACHGALWWHTEIKRPGSKVSKVEERERKMWHSQMIPIIYQDFPGMF